MRDLYVKVYEKKPYNGIYLKEYGMIFSIKSDELYTMFNPGASRMILKALVD